MFPIRGIARLVLSMHVHRKEHLGATRRYGVGMEHPQPL